MFIQNSSIEEKTASYYCESDDKKSFSSIPIRCENEYKLVEQKLTDKVEQNSSWSKEDEQNLNGIVATMEEDAQLPKDTIKRLCKWLKAIKDRVQPKQEWSKEDS